MDAVDESEQNEKQDLQIQYGTLRGVWFLRDDLQWPSAGQWQIEFVPTYKARSGFINCAYTSKSVYRWRFCASDRTEALAMFCRRATECGMQHVVIVSISRCEAIINVEQGALYGQAKRKN